MVSRNRLKKCGARKKVERLKKFTSEREHSIRLWNKYDGSWDVTHHAQAPDGYLHDVDKDFKNFKSLNKAIEYMRELRSCQKGHVREFGFDVFGYQMKDGGWSGVPENKKQLPERVIEKHFTPADAPDE
jgi:hypothetical protein